MFWGLIMEPNKRYTQVVDKAFHISMACLDTKSASDDNPVQVMLCYENRKYVICNLNKSHHPQSPLDLNFDTGSKITFVITSGNSNVHLTGYHIPDATEDSEDEANESMLEKVMNEMSKKRKGSSMDDMPQKKSKKDENVHDEEDDDDDDSDDEDFMNMESGEDEEASDEEMDEDESDDDLEDEEEDDEDDDDDEEEEEVKEEKPKVEKQVEHDKKSKKQKKEHASQKHMNGNATEKKEVKEKKEESKVQKRTIEGGVQVEDLKTGSGQPAKKGQMVYVHYVGRLKNGKKFDSMTSGKGFNFRLGRSEVIKGWDIGIQGMKIGGKRRLTIPPALAYGAKGQHPVIPGNSTLIFEVELKSIH